MSRSRQALGVLIVALFGLWGCSRAPSADGGSAEKLKAVESKLARLEDDFRAAASARDQLTKKLIAAEEARTALLKQVEALTRDAKTKDELVQARTAERDQAAGQLKTLKDGLKELLAKAEGETKPDGSPAVPVIPTSNPKPEK
jgi:chromosome segregation ATPase